MAGETVRVLVASSAGGTGDLQARLVADRLSEVLPGHPAIIVQNVPGGAGLRLLEFVDQLDAATEHFVYVIPSNMPFEARAGAIAPEAFDPRAVQWVGSYAGSAGVCVVSAASGITSVEGFRTRRVTMGVTEVSSNTYASYRMLQEAGLMIDPVVGYDSYATITLAVLRNELDGLCTSYATYVTLLRPEVEKGTLIPVLSTGPYPLPDLGIPWMVDLEMPAGIRPLVETAVQVTSFARPWVAAPDADPDFVAAIRTAFAGIVADPVFAAQTAALDVEVRYASPEDIAAAVDQLYATPDTLIAEVFDLLFAE
ncbi:MAG: PhnD/SsuA/transferrin family substrate-binding protein [Bauldia sp.]|nr:PhnD/SsuA/transferrin family substrate-binding protein [Bauldia sp.]